MARFQRGSLRKEMRSGGETWVLRFYRTRAGDGKRVEATRAIGSVAAIGKSEAAAWREIDRLHIHTQINAPRHSSAPTFKELACSYLTHELPRLAPTTGYTVRHNLDAYLLPRWGEQVAVDIQPLDIEAWFGLLAERSLANGTISKLRGVMHQVFRHSQRVGLISRSDESNPVKFSRASAKTNYRAVLIKPEQAAEIIGMLENPERVLALLSAATGLRISESLGLKWSDVEFDRGLIHVRRTWIQGKVGKPKTESSASAVPLHGILAEALDCWRAQTLYAGDSDWVFASNRKRGKQPREGNVAAADYLRPAAVRAGVILADYKGRFGWHNFRHSLAHHLVRTGTDAKTVQGLLRHAKVQTTLDLYAQSVPGDRMSAQGQMLQAMGFTEAV